MSAGARSLLIGVGGFPDTIATEEDHASGTRSFTRLNSVAPAVEGLARALQRVGVQPAVAPLVDPRRDKVEAAWDQVVDTFREQPLIVHFSGHGVRSRSKSLYLVPLDGEAAADRLNATCISMDKLLQQVEDSFSEPVLFLLDVCGGGQALATQLAQEFAAWERKAWVIAACKADEATHGAAFTRATTAVLDRLAKNVLDLSPALEYVPLDTLAAEIDRELARKAHAARLLGQSVVRTMREEAHVDPPPIFRNPAYNPQAAGQFLAREDANLRQFAINLDPGLDPLHFITRAAGRTTDHTQSSAFLFCGRTAQLRRIANWLDNAAGKEGRLLVVTGGPGTGKSALLGMTVCVTHPALAPLRQHALSAASSFRPAPGKRVIAVHARQLSTQQITDSLLRQLADHLPTQSARGPATDTTAADGMKVLMDALRQAGPTVVILDALDEAIDPAAVLRDLLLPLAGHTKAAAVPECRVMIGTRPWWESLRDLHTALAATPDALLDLDTQNRDSLAQDIAAYLGLLLYGLYPQTTTDAIARELAHRADQGAFLIAAVYGNHLKREAEAGRASDPEQIAAQLPHSITEMFDLHTAALSQSNPWIRPLLAVLGHAQGQGMPLDLLHTAALALAPEFRDSHLPPDLQQTQAALTEAAFYLRTNPDEDQRMLYRYFHQALVDHAAPTADPRTLYRALLQDFESATGEVDWERAHPYLRRHAAAHAEAAGAQAIDELLADPFFLLHAHPDHLAPYLSSARSSQAVQLTSMYRDTVVPHFGRYDPAARRSLLAIGATARHEPLLTDTLTNAPINHQLPFLTPRWATGHTSDPAHLYTLTGHTAVVRSVGSAVLPDGRTVAVTGDHQGRIIVWDLSTGLQVHPALTGHTDVVWAVKTAVLPDGRAIAITIDEKTNALGWDLSTGHQIRTPLPGLKDSVWAVDTAVLPDGRAIAITGDWNGQVLVWDLSTGQQIHPAGTHAYRGYRGEEVLVDVATWKEVEHGLAGDMDGVWAIGSAVLPDGRTVAIAGDEQGSVFVWDLTTRRLMHCMRNAHDAPVCVVASAVLPDGRTVAITSDEQGTTLVWDLSTGQLIHPPLVAETDRVFSVASAVLADGCTVAITSDGEGTTLVWDLSAGQLIDSVLAARTATVIEVASTVLPDGRTVAITGGMNVEVWDLAPTERSRAAVSHAGLVLAVASAMLPDGRAAAITGGIGGEVFVWDLASGEHIHSALTGHTAAVYAVASAVLPDGRTAAITGGIGGEVFVWDLASGEHIHSALTGHTATVWAVASAVLPDGHTIAITGDWEGEVFVWDLASGEHIHSALTGHTAAVYAVASAVLPDGRTIAITGDGKGEVLVWDLITGHHMGQPLSGHTEAVWAVASAVLPDGRTVAITGDGKGEVRVWDLTTGQQVQPPLTGHTAAVRAAASTVLPDGRTVAITGDVKGEVRVWDLTTGQPIPSGITVPGSWGATLASTDRGIVVGYGHDVAYLKWCTAFPPQPSDRAGD